MPRERLHWRRLAVTQGRLMVLERQGVRCCVQQNSKTAKHQTSSKQAVNKQQTIIKLQSTYR
jgi:hypothetical protein